MASSNGGYQFHKESRKKAIRAKHISSKKNWKIKKRESNILNKIVLVECFYSDMEFTKYFSWS